MTGETTPSVLNFCGYQLDPAEAQLCSGAQIIPLRPKTFALLAYLVARSGHLVTKHELLDAIWPETSVGEWVLTASVKELRRALADDAREPRIIETHYGRGYRFIAAVYTTTPQAAETTHAIPEATALVGRAAELVVLDGWLQQALARKRQVGFVVGEAGIGKSALIDEFVRRLGSRVSPNTRTPALLAAYGQCLEHYSTSEPYLPIIEALGQLCATADGAPLLALLRQLASSWLGLLPALAPAPGQDVATSAASPERMRRELAAVVDALPLPLVLVLEDLHWADLETVDLLVRLAQGRSPTRLLIIGTYRAAEIALQAHPLKAVHQELLGKGQCRDLWLSPLDTEAVTAYLQQRCPGLEPAAALAGVVYQRTDGNALFVVNVINELVATGVLAHDGAQWTLTVPVAAVEVGVPDGLRQLLITRLERHDESQRAVLDAGSVAGRSFSAAEVAAALDLPLVEVESTLETLARRSHVLRSAGAAVWPDTTAANRYEFVHALYEEVLYDLIPAARRRVSHGRIAERLERGHAGNTADIAIHLARHFEAGGMAERAVAYLEEGAERVSRYGAERETATVLERAVHIVEGLPRTPDRVLHAIRIYLRLGQAFFRSRGLTALQSERAFARAWALSQESDDAVQLFQATIGRMAGYVAGARFGAADEMAQHLAGLMQRIPLPQFTFAGHLFLAIAQYHGGSLAEARAHLDQVLEIGELPQPPAFMNFWVLALTYVALISVQQGHPDQARQWAQQALARAATESPYVYATAASWAVYVSVNARDAGTLAIAAEIAQRIGGENGELMATAVGSFGNGWLLAQRGDSAAGIAAMQAGIDTLRATGQVTSLPAMMTSLAEAYVHAGDLDESLRRITETQACIHSSGEIRFAAEAHRVEGEIHRARGDFTAAQRAFSRAIEIARAQGARWWELRATVSHARLLQQQGKRLAAQRVLEPIMRGITEGDDSEDVRAARDLLATLARRPPDANARSTRRITSSLA